MKRPVIKQYTPMPERAQCSRCKTTFIYDRTTKPRLYCDLCLVLERQDANDFANNLARQKRLASRMNAFLMHEVENA